MILFLLLATAAHAGSLSATAVYTVNKALHDPGVAPKLLPSFRNEVEIDFQSFDANDASGEPLMSTHTEQTMKLRKLPKLDPKDPAAPKDGFLDRTELTFERLVSTSKVRIPGMARPFETRADIGTLLGKEPLLLRGDGKSTKKIDNLEKVKGDALAHATDLGTRSTINTLLSETVLLRAGDSPGADSTCLGRFGGKKIGDQWSFTREEQGMKLDYRCTFEGWAENGGKKIAVIRLHAAKVRVARTLPNGAPGMAEMEGDGAVYFEPTAQASLLKNTTDITVAPTDAEVERLKAKGATVPRNRSVLKMTERMDPL